MRLLFWVILLLARPPEAEAAPLRSASRAASPASAGARSSAPWETGARTLRLSLAVAASSPEAERWAADVSFHDSLRDVPVSASFAADRLLESFTAQDPLRELLRKAIADYFRARTFFPEPSGFAQPSGRPALSLDLKAARNRQWSSPARTVIGGVPHALSGQFTRRLKAFFAVLPDGAELPRFLSLDSIIDGAARLEVKGRAYRLSVTPDLLAPLASRIVIRSEADRADARAVAMDRMLEVSHSAGEALDDGQGLTRAFFGQDIDDSREPAVPGQAESFAFITRQGGQYFTYLIAREKVPEGGRFAVFRLHRGREYLLGIEGWRLLAYPR